MLCRRPYIRDPSGKVLVSTDPEVRKLGIPFPCGQCLACRINKRRVWTLRLLLESYLHPCASFVTLTYEPDELPYNLDGQPILCKRDVQLFLKRLRDDFQRNNGFSGGQIRYYFAGEYGPQGHLPHYHGILFGVSPFELDDQWMYFAGRSGPYKPNYCRSSRLYNLWKHGIVHIGECTRGSIQYCAGYVTKKITRKEMALKKNSLLCLDAQDLEPELLLRFHELCKAYPEIALEPERGRPYALTVRSMLLDGSFWTSSVESLTWIRALMIMRSLLGSLSESQNGKMCLSLHISLSRTPKGSGI